MMQGWSGGNPKPFRERCAALMDDHQSMPWQEEFFSDRFAKAGVPLGPDIPTGLRKTSVMAIWYLARKATAALPRRPVYSSAVGTI